jgi:hypothetical protein
MSLAHRGHRSVLAGLEELVEWSKGKVRAGVAHGKISVMGYAGRADDPPGGRPAEVGLGGGAAAGAPAVGAQAGDGGAVRLR